nr:unnamed protein product [Leishmania braziliensis]
MRFLSGFSESFADASETWRCPNFCAWDGVTCTEEGFFFELGGVVTSGTLPEVSADCNGSSVPVLKISAGGAEGNVSLKGSLPSTWSELVSLVELDLSHTGVSGAVPVAWSALLRLKKLNLGFNGLSGVLPKEWSGLAALEELFLNDNSFTGSVPIEWFTMYNLQILDVSNNKFNGFLPGFLLAPSRARMPGVLRKLSLTVRQ